MKNRDQIMHRHREHHPQVSIGLFLIVLGLALLVATNDLLNLGSVQDYFTWETALIFIGVLLLLNLHFTGGLLMIALGTWFLIDHLDYELPEIIKTIYWPSVVILVGLGFIISSLFKRKKTDN
jgi:cytochrome c oxidase subunit IV